MPYCPMWKWYEYEGSVRKPGYPINSAITGSIKVTSEVTKASEVLVATIATDSLEKDGKYLRCTAIREVKEILDLEAKGQNGEVRHYGLIIIQPGEEKLSESKVVDFISFHRHPTEKRVLPTDSQYEISEYNRMFEKLVLEQAQPSTRPPIEAAV